MLMSMALEVFEIKASDGLTFRCSDSFFWQWLHNVMGWLECKVTCAARKVPDNWEDICEKAALRIAYVIKEEDVSALLYVNSNQTQIIYAQGSSLTWTKWGTKQVSTIGEDEKRAFTAIVSVLCSGKLPPLQMVYQGSTTKSCPQPTPAHYNECISHRFQFECLKTDTYWSTHATMESLVNNIIVPYFEAEKKGLDFLWSKRLSGRLTYGQYITQKNSSHGWRSNTL